MKEVGRSALFPPSERSSSSSSSSSTANHQLVILPRRVGQAPPPRPPPPVVIRQPPSDHIFSVNRTPTVSTAIVGRRLATSATPSTATSIRSRPTRSASPPTQELVSLDNPRPKILRGANEYSDISRQLNESADRQSRGMASKQRHASSSGPASWANSSNFDRPKVHATNSCGSTKQLGEIKPLVRTAADSGSKPPPLPTSRKQQSQSDSSKLHLKGVGGAVPPTDHLFEGDFHDLRTLVGEARPASSPPSLAQHSVRRARDVVDRPPLPVGAGGQLNEHAAGGDILCRRCGLCRCSQCCRPRALPSTWICNDACLVSAQCLVDAASCMCCVRGCLYHCVLPEDNDGAGVGPSQVLTDDSALFSCESPGACARWSCLSAAALLLPCVWCYLPFKACAAGAQAVYSRYHHHGCRCDRRHPHLLEHQRHSLASNRSLANSVISQQPTKLKDDIPFDHHRYSPHSIAPSQHFQNNFKR